MMKEYIDKTADVQFLRAQIPTLVQEMEFFEQRRSVEVEREGKTYTLFTFPLHMQPTWFLPATSPHKNQAGMKYCTIHHCVSDLQNQNEKK